MILPGLQRTARREKLMEISFLGLRLRCQYWQVATGLGSTTPAVYAACHMPCRLTLLVTSCTTLTPCFGGSTECTCAEECEEECLLQQLPARQLGGDYLMKSSLGPR